MAFKRASIPAGAVVTLSVSVKVSAITGLGLIPTARQMVKLTTTNGLLAGMVMARAGVVV